MGDHYPGQYPQAYDHQAYPPPNDAPLPPQDQQQPHGEAQDYYDQNQTFNSQSYDDYDSDDSHSNHKHHQKKHHRKHRSHGTHRATQNVQYAYSMGQTAANIRQPTLEPGFLGTLKGFRDLARKKPYVSGDTMERLELLRRADDFFNSGFIGRFGGLSRDKTGGFRTEMERLSEVLHEGQKEHVRGRFGRDRRGESKKVDLKGSSESEKSTKSTKSSHGNKSPKSTNSSTRSNSTSKRSSPDSIKTSSGNKSSNVSKQSKGKKSSSGTSLSGSARSSSIAKFSNGTNHGVVDPSEGRRLPSISSQHSHRSRRSQMPHDKSRDNWRN